MLTLSQRLDDEREDDEAEEHDVELLEAGEDAPEALEAPEEPLDLVAPLVHLPVVLPGVDSVALGRHHGVEAEVQGQLACGVVLVGLVHDQRRGAGGPVQLAHELAALRGVVRVAGGEGEGDRRSGIRGNHMNFGVPSAAGLADGLRAVFLGLPCRRGAP